jgi:hypothetical protein
MIVDDIDLWVTNHELKAPQNQFRGDRHGLATTL